MGSTLSSIQAGRFVPLLQMGRRPSRLIPALEGVPHLGGDDGLAARRPELFHPSGDAGVGTARARADQLGTFTSLGRLVVAPRGMPDGLRECLETAVSSVLEHPDFRASASATNRPLDVASAADVREELTEASAALTGLLPAVERAARRAR